MVKEMVVRRIKKSAAVIIILLIILVGANLPVYAAVTAPRVSVSYTNQTATTVDVTLTWDNPGNGTSYDVYWADSMISDGSGLDYSGHAVSITTSGGKYSATKTLQLYRNYYFKVSNYEGAESATSNVRVYPVKTGAGRQTNEYAHGNFSENTAMCAYCHNTHASVKAQLVKEATYYQMCKLCHGTASTQSKYDVEAGTVAVDGGTVPSLAGPFVDNVTSKHNADDSAPDWKPESIPGSDSNKMLSLTCISCHDVHARSDDNYRLVRKVVYADDAKTESLKTINIDFDAYAITPTSTSGEQLYMVKGNTEFCSSCHMDYDDGTGQVPGKDSRVTTSEAVYRHPTTVGSQITSVFGADGTLALAPSDWGPLPLQYNASEKKTGITDKRTSVVCSTCHYAHGTTKKFNTDAGVNQYILRLDNYGTCESCHKK